MTENVVPFARPDRPRKPRRIRHSIPAGTPLEAMLDSWQLQLEAANKAKQTYELYSRSARLFITFLREHDMPCDAEGVAAEHVRAFLVAETARTSARTAGIRHDCLSVWFNWMIAEEERTTLSPVLRADKPKSPKKVRPYLTDDELRRLLEACKGSGFGERRDTAMILILIDNGARVSGLAGLQLDDVDLRGHRLRIVLKGGDEFWAPIGKKTAAAIDRYLRVRAQHPYASATTALWLPLRGVRSGQMTRYGVADMLKRRGAQAQVAGVHPHRFRGTAAHKLLAAGAGDSDVQHILGWTSRAMVEHYTGELSLERARATHARLSPGDQI